MLQIRTSDLLLDIPDDIQIDLTIENPFMLVDRIPLPYTLTFDLPPTPGNLRKLKYPNRITALNTNYEVDCSIWFYGLNFLNGILAITGFDGNIKVSFRGISVLDNLKKKLYLIEMEQTTIGTARLTVPPTTGFPEKWVIDYSAPGNIGEDYKYLSKTAAYGLVDNFMAAPVRIEGESFTRSTAESSIGEISIYIYSLLADNMYFNFWNAENKDFVLKKRPKAPTHDREMAHANVFPYPYLHYLFDILFSGILTSNPFKTGELRQLVLLSTFHPNYFKRERDIDYEEFCGILFDNMKDQNANFTAYFQMNSFLGDLDANEFLKNIMKIFCFSIFPEKGKFKIRSNKDIIADNNVENWTMKVMDSLAIEKVPVQTYKYGYADINDEKVEVVEENKVNTINNLIDVDLSDAPLFTSNFYVKTTGEYYKKEKVDTKDVYSLLNSGLGGNQSMDNSFDTTSEVTPLPMCVTEYWTELNTYLTSDPPPMKLWYVPQFSGNRMVRNSKANIMFARGIRPTRTSGEGYPLLTATNYDHTGERLGDYSLAWEGDDGLLNRFHKEFKEYVQKLKIRISGDFSLTAADIKNLDLSKKKHIQGRNFYIEKIQISFTKYRILPAQIDLIEA